MDKYNIILNVRGSHIENEEENTLELLTEGSLMQDDGTYIIEYEESEISGVKDTLTRLIIDEDSVHLRRIGSLDTEFVFARQRLYEASYSTPYGNLIMSLLPTQVESDLSREKGSIDLEYIIKIGEQSALNRLNINYKLRN